MGRAGPVCAGPLLLRYIVFGHDWTIVNWGSGRFCRLWPSLTSARPVPNLNYMPRQPKEPRARFSQNSGNGSGVQVIVDARDLTHPPSDSPTLEHGAGKGRKTKLAAFGLNPTLVRSGDPGYAAALHQANKYRKMRMKELAQLHGHCSAGVGALLASASLALAASRFMYELAAADPQPQLLKDASKLASEARQNELAAYEVAAREGVLKRRHAADEAGQPWLLNANGDELAKSGRKTNLERNMRDNGDGET